MYHREIVHDWFIQQKNIFSKVIKDFFLKLIQFFHSRRLQEVDKADGFENLGKIKWELALSLLVVFFVVYFALWKGIKSSGKVRF